MKRYYYDEDFERMMTHEKGKYVKYSEVEGLIELAEYLSTERNPNIYVAIDKAMVAMGNIEALKKAGLLPTEDSEGIRCPGPGDA